MITLALVYDTIEIHSKVFQGFLDLKANHELSMSSDW